MILFLLYAAPLRYMDADTAIKGEYIVVFKKESADSDRKLLDKGGQFCRSLCIPWHSESRIWCRVLQTCMVIVTMYVVYMTCMLFSDHFNPL